MLDLADRGLAKGWVWCSAVVEPGVDHSWVEYEGCCVDMGDNHKLRIRSAAAPPFTITEPVERRDATQTKAWVEEHEAGRAPSGDS